MRHTLRSLRLFYFALICIHLVSPIKQNEKLKLLGVIHINRHGARSPKSYPDKYNSLFFGSSQLSLTMNGARQLEQVGHYVNDQYVKKLKLLSSNYNEKESVFKVSPTQRTIFSAISFVKGLYPNTLVKFIILSNDSRKIKTDDIAPIANYTDTTPEIKVQIIDPNKDYYFKAKSCLQNSTGSPLEEMMAKETIYNITDEEIHQAVDEVKLQIPEAFQETEEMYNIKILKKISPLIFSIQYHSNGSYFSLSDGVINTLKKIQIAKLYERRLIQSVSLTLSYSGLVSDFLKNLQAYVGGSQLKYTFYSGHDSNIVSFLVLFLSTDYIRTMINDYSNYYSFLHPKFGSQIFIELFEIRKTSFLNGKQMVVRICYNGEVLKEGLKEEIKYDESLEGIDYKKFAEFLIRNIDPEFVNLSCNKDDDE